MHKVNSRTCRSADFGALGSRAPGTEAKNMCRVPGRLAEVSRAGVSPSRRVVRRTGRRGVTLIEITAAAAMLAVLLVSTVQVMRVLATQQKAALRRTMALQAVQALTEELANTPWDQLTPDAANKLTIPDVVNLYLPGAAFSAAVAEEAEPVASKRLSLELRWRAPGGQPAGPVKLTAWVIPEDLQPPQ